MGAKFYRDVLMKAPTGYVYHQIITDEEGEPVDYRFIEVNRTFEQLPGLQESQITGKTAREVMPGIGQLKFNWIKTYGKLALQGVTEEFEQFSEPLQSWYKVKVHSPEKSYFITLFCDTAKQTEI